MNQERPISVLVVDDSAFMRTAIRRIVESDPSLNVVATATDGREALDSIERFDPDVVTMDIEMPRMNGIDAVRRIMATAPRPVIMISSLTTEGAVATLEAFEAGAFDCIPKALSYVSLDIIKITEELITKIHAAADFGRKARAVRRAPCTETTAPVSRIIEGPLPISPRIICIGISTGGPKALQEILPLVPDDLIAPIVIVQHMPLGFTGPFAQRLNSLCAIAVSEARADEVAEPGHVYIAPAGWQLTPQSVSSRVVLKLSKVPSSTPHIPSVDVMMTSAAQAFGSATMGIIMTGMGNDGEAGMRAIHKAGGFTIGQDEASCVVYGMPRACAEAGLLRRVVPLERIPVEISNLVRHRRPVPATASFAVGFDGNALVK